MAVIPLDNLGLSGRTRNVLFRLGIRTLDDLRAVSIEELAQQRNIGLFVLSEIKRVLSENDISDLVTGADDLSKKEKEINTKSPAEAIYSTEQIEEMKQYSITELKLSQRASKPLLSSHYETIDSIASLKIEELYGSMTAYMDTEIFSNDVVDLAAIDRRLSSLSSFVSALDKKRNSLEFIETAPKILVSIRKIKEIYGLNQEDIRQIQKMLIPYYKAPYFNAHSLWDKVKDLSLIRKLQGNEWMLSCIMRQQESVFAQHFAGNMILSLDSNSLSLSKISLWFSSVCGKMSLNMFAAKFNDYFGCKIENYKFAEKLKSADVWDDIVTDSMDEYMDSLLDFSKMKEDDLFAEEFL